MKQVQLNQTETSTTVTVRKDFLKDFCITAAMFFMPAFVFCQSFSFNGEWVGKLMMKEKAIEIEKRMVIDNGKVIKYSDERKDESWFDSIDFESSIEGESFKIAWSEKSKFGSQAEKLNISFISKDTIKVAWLRECNIYGDKWQPGDIGWQRNGSGYMVRTPGNIVARRE